MSTLDTNDIKIYKDIYANALMAVFGLKLDEASVKKVQEWRDELDELKDPGGFIRKMQKIYKNEN